VVADASADPRERVVFFDDPQGVGVAALADQGDVTLGALTGRAGVAAGGNAELLDGVGVRDGLGIQLVSCPARRQPLVERIGDDDRTDRGAVAAADALQRVDVARLVAQGGDEVAGLAVEPHDLAVDVQVDVQVAAGLDQLRADGAHGAVIGGEGLVELGHVPADGGPRLDEVHAEALVGQVEAGLHSGDAAADDEDRAGRRRGGCVGGVSAGGGRIV